MQITFVQTLFEDFVSIETFILSKIHIKSSESRELNFLQLLTHSHPIKSEKH
jgi:hypothetical protein